MKKLHEKLAEDWNVQGFIATPLFITICANRGLTMQDKVGANYSSFLYHIRGDYCDMSYNIGDLKRIWKTVKEHYNKDPQYFVKLRKDYQELQLTHVPFKKKMDAADLSFFSDEEIVSLLQDSLRVTENSVDFAHIIEAFSMLHDRALAQLISNKVPDKKQANKYTEILSQPITKTWMNDSDLDLAEIKKLPVEEQDKRLDLHTKKFYWIKNQYLDATPLTKDDFKKQMAELKDFEALDYSKKTEQKEKIMAEIEFSKEERNIVHLIEFFADWQDDRKRYILMALHYNDLLVHETGKRFNIQPVLIKYLLQDEVTLETFKRKDIVEMLKTRRKGVLIVSEPGKNTFFTGRILHDLEKSLQNSHDSSTQELHGMIASTGTVVGKAVVCKTVENVDSVEEGDILVASMTRPEYVTAMKKASAIVTDEGGITCHAAIVSRELGIPCVIGTKNATKVIKTGDIVEVKGHHGLVVILSSKKER